MQTRTRKCETQKNRNEMKRKCGRGYNGGGKSALEGKERRQRAIHISAHELNINCCQFKNRPLNKQKKHFSPQPDPACQNDGRRDRSRPLTNKILCVDNFTCSWIILGPLKRCSNYDFASSSVSTFFPIKFIRCD